MKFIMWSILCAVGLAYIPWQWTWANAAGKVSMQGNYSWLWKPAMPPIEFSIGWETSIDVTRWMIQAVIILIIWFGVIISLRGKK